MVPSDLKANDVRLVESHFILNAAPAHCPVQVSRVVAAVEAGILHQQVLSQYVVGHHTESLGPPRLHGTGEDKYIHVVTWLFTEMTLGIPWKTK
jgi:hypothetical protein